MGSIEIVLIVLSAVGVYGSPENPLVDFDEVGILIEDNLKYLDTNFGFNPGYFNFSVDFCIRFLS